MKWTFGIALIIAAPAALATAAQLRAPLNDSVRLNIGINCQWQQQCMAGQQRAMRRALSYVSTRHPPPARIKLCNRNAARGRARTDWAGFDNCIRNTSLRTSSPRASARRPRRR